MKKKNIKVSVIVPVYNAEKTLHRCMDSLLNQDYSNIEIILVNDGSKDKSLKILKEYEKKHSDIIKVFSHDNCGSGETRNRGIKEATGDYITFTDADDALDSDAISTLVNNVDKNVDIVISGMRRINEETNEVIFDIKPLDCLWSEFKYTATQFKLYKSSFLKKNKLKYISYKIGEDVYFSLSCFSKTKNIKIVSESKYIYFSNDSSLTTTINSNGKKYDIILVLKEIYDKIDFSKYPKKMVQYFYIKTIVQNIIMQLDAISVNDLNDLYLKNYKWLKDKKINSNHIRLNWQEGETFSINLIVNVFILLSRIRLQKFLIFCLKKCKKIRVR